MTQVGARKIAAAVAVAGLIEGPGIVGEFRTLNSNFARRREERAIPSVASRKDAIEQIKAGTDIA